MTGPGRANVPRAPLRIVHLAAFYRPHVGGIENYVHYVAQAQAAAGHAVEILTMDTEGVGPRETEGDVVVHRARVTLRYYKGIYSRDFNAQLRDLAAKADILHVHAPFPLGLEAAVRAARRARGRRGSGERPKVVVTYHGEGRATSQPLYAVPRAAYSRWEKRSLSRADQTAFLTESYRASLRMGEALRRSSTVVETGVDTTRFRPLGRGESRALGGVFPILFVGSLHPANRYKGVDVLLRALVLLPEDVVLHVVGRGDLVAEYQALAAKLGLMGRVTFHTDVSDEALPAVVRSARLFVLPSVSGPENGPLVVLEAMASGVPVLATRIPGVREMLRDGELGPLAEPGDAKDLARLIEACRADKKGLAARAKQVRRHVEANHDWALVASRYEDLYRAQLGAAVA